MSIPFIARLQLGLRTFATDVAQGFFAISHNGLAVVGLSIFFFVVALTVRPDLRVLTETKLIGWLQERQYDELGIATDADAVSTTTTAGAPTTSRNIGYRPPRNTIPPPSRKVRWRNTVGFGTIPLPTHLH